MEPNTNITENQIPPGQTGDIVVFINRDGLTPRTYRGKILVYYFDDLVGTIIVDMQVGLGFQ